MGDLRACAIISRKHPETLDFEVVKESDSNAAVTEARDAKLGLNDGLDMLQLVPRDEAGNPKLIGLQLFWHMCTFRNIEEAKKKTDGKDACVVPQGALNVERFRNR